MCHYMYRSWTLSFFLSVASVPVAPVVPQSGNFLKTAGINLPVTSHQARNMAYIWFGLHYYLIFILEGKVMHLLFLLSWKMGVGCREGEEWGGGAGAKHLKEKIFNFSLDHGILYL